MCRYWLCTSFLSYIYDIYMSHEVVVSFSRYCQTIFQNGSVSQHYHQYHQKSSFYCSVLSSVLAMLIFLFLIFSFYFIYYCFTMLIFLIWPFRWVISLCLYLHFPDAHWDWSFSHVPVGYLNATFCDLSSYLLPNFLLGSLCFSYRYAGVLYIFFKQILYWLYVLQLSLSMLWLTFLLP